MFVITENITERPVLTLPVLFFYDTFPAQNLTITTNVALYCRVATEFAISITWTGTGVKDVFISGRNPGCIFEKLLKQMVLGASVSKRTS
jgi:hypothetical protein